MYQLLVDRNRLSESRMSYFVNVFVLRLPSQNCTWIQPNFALDVNIRVHLMFTMLYQCTITFYRHTSTLVVYHSKGRPDALRE